MMNDHEPIQPSLFLALEISPDSMIAFHDAQNAIQRDKILDEDFVHNHSIRRCVYFLYGKEYGSEMTRDERVAAIQTLVGKKSRNLGRLGRVVALSDASDKISFQENTLETYVLAVSTARIFFDENGVVGGFPRWVFLRYQASRCCYVVSVCVWLSLQHQRDSRPNNNANDERELNPMDVTQGARHNIITDDHALKNRVLRDRGRSAILSAEKLTGRSREEKQWYLVDFEPSRLPVGVLYWLLLLLLLSSTVPWPWSGRFRVADPFFRASKLKQSVPGYWKFDGLDINVEDECL
jgi:hypothetical protein